MACTSAARPGTGWEVGADLLDVLTFRDLVARAAYDAPETALLRLAQAAVLRRGEIDVERLASSPLYTAVHSEYATAARTFATRARDLGRPEQALTPLRGLASRQKLDGHRTRNWC